MITVLAFLVGTAAMVYPFMGTGLAPCLALLIGPGAVARRLAGAGGDVEDIVGTSRGFARRMAAIYVELTLAGIAVTALVSGDVLTAVVHVLAAGRRAQADRGQDPTQGGRRGGRSHPQQAPGGASRALVERKAARQDGALVDPDHQLAEVAALLHQPEGLAGLGKRKHPIDHGF